jgi:hypothetical protein
MSTVERTFQWLERAGDWANPILVKETRQALKSRQFVITFMLVLGSAWIVSAFWLLRSGPSLEYEATGRQLFYWFYVVLAVATVLVVPFTAFRSLQSERELNTYELLNVTTLSPRQIVWGKLFSALVQLFIFYSAITPFIAFASLLQGFDTPRAAFVLVGSMLVSLFLSMEVLMFATLAKQRVGQGFSAIVALSQLSFALFGALGFVLQAIELDTLRIDNRDFWVATGVVLVFGASYFVLFQQVTTAQLTFESDNRSTAIRITGMVQFWMLWAALAGWAYFYAVPMGLMRGFESVLTGLATASTVHWTVFGLFMATEGDFLSRRVRRGLPRSPVVRFLSVPFLPGGGRGYLNLILQMATLWCVVVAFSAWNAHWTGSATVGEFLAGLAMFELSSWNAGIRLTSALCCYLLFYLGIACALARWGMAISSEVRPGHARVLTIFVVLAGIIGSYIPVFLELVDWRRYSLVQISNPASTIVELGRGTDPSGMILALLAAGACAAVALNLRAMFRGALDILRSPPGPAAEPVRHPAANVLPST